MQQMEQVRAKVLLEGRVQGVGMRYYTQQRALELGLTGFVRHITEGRIEVVFEGPSEQVETLLTWFQDGSPQAQVDTIALRYEEPEGQYSTFHVK